MTIAIVTASHKRQGESTRIGHWLANAIQKDGYDTVMLDLQKVDFPMWDEGMWGADGLADKWSKKWQPWAEQLQQAEGVVIISPEYGGLVSPALKNFFLLAGGAELAHKPGLIVGVSASKNGAYPIAELRMTSSKNNKLCYIPDHLIIRNAAKMLQTETEAEFQEENEFLQERIDYTLGVFYEYIKGLQKVRRSGKVETEKFKYGM
ncbi:MAG: NAD(P)H-dependent oxidoreductase [Alphaproteobacteria bacterium]|nr:NAD(P)H-dependent oxidoreductase [Alphaproteobacteria bacterium]MDD9919986.1 NAD(P)H-dependent oxidoreductase [Alphaproteobacteria bacterium]